jgi:hypothetical protein
MASASLTAQIHEQKEYCGEREKGEEGCAHKIVKREKEGEREEEKIKWCQWVAVEFNFYINFAQGYECHDM